MPRDRQRTANTGTNTFTGHRARYDGAGRHRAGERHDRGGERGGRAVQLQRVGAPIILDGPVAVVCTPSSGSIFPLGTTTVTCTATDAHANSAGKTFTVTVVDTTGPVISVPANMTVEAPGPAGVAVSYVVTAIDAVSGVVTPTCTPASGATFPLDTTTVNCSATDARSNTRTASFTVTVVNASKPIVAVTAPANAATVSGASVTVSATASHPLGIAGVQFKVDGISIGAEDTTAAVLSRLEFDHGPERHAHADRHRARQRRRTNTASVAVTVTNAPGTVDLAVDGNQKFQTISGFMVNANSASWNNGQLTPALDLLIDQGVSIFRVIVDKEDWEATNDNADPNVFNWIYYNTIYTSA